MLETLFSDIDSYRPDAGIRERTEGIDDEQLRTRVNRAINSLILLQSKLQNEGE